MGFKATPADAVKQEFYTSEAALPTEEPAADATDSAKADPTDSEKD